MALQNIGVSNQDDAFYRYKMPKLITKVEGRGNGIKTNLSNMVDVAKALGRPPAYTTKYFGCELGAQSKFDEKTGTAIVNGAHETGKLAALLENFIKKYVQCYGCGNPETEILISKSQLISLKCAACGFVSDVDMRDKLTNFILKNPPEQKKKDKKGMRKAEKERLKAGEALDEEMKKSKKELKVKKIHEGNGNVSAKKKVPDGDVEGHSPSSSQRDESEEDEDEDEDVVEWITDTSALAAQQRIKEQLTAATSELVMLINAENGEQKPKATVKKTSVTSSGNDEHRLNGAVKKTSKEVAAFGKEITDSVPVKSQGIYEALVKDFRKCIDDEFDEKQLVKRLYSVHPHSSEQEVMNAYFEALFQGTSKGLSKEINKKKLFLTQAMAKGEHSQRLLLGAMEAYCSSGSLQLQKEISAVLKMLYDLDILEEDDIVTWYNGVSDSSDVRKFAKPFVDWLQSAESEED